MSRFLALLLCVLALKGLLSAPVAAEPLPWLRLLLLETDALDGTLTPLALPPAEGRIILEHHWGVGDLPTLLRRPGGVTGASLMADGTFRVVSPAGRFKVVTDPETGRKVLDILVRREDSDIRTHTEIHSFVPGELLEARGYKPRQRYSRQWWRKNLSYVPDGHLEIELQVHGWPDNDAERGRNPPLAIGGGAAGRMTLSLRASPEATTPRRRGDLGWAYSRDDFLPDIGPNSSDLWEFWELVFVLDPEGIEAMIALSRNGELVHSEAGKPFGFNDARGPVIHLGIYKNFRPVTTRRRQSRIGPIRVQELPD